MVAVELSFLIATGAHGRVSGVDGLRRHGRLEERRTDFKVDCKVSGLASSWRTAKRLIIPETSDDDAVEFPSSCRIVSCCCSRSLTLCRRATRFYNDIHNSAFSDRRRFYVDARRTVMCDFSVTYHHHHQFISSTVKNVRLSNTAVLEQDNKAQCGTAQNIQQVTLLLQGGRSMLYVRQWYK